MYLSSKSVEFHLSNLYRKLGLRSRVQLAGRLTDAGIRPITPADVIDTYVEIDLLGHSVRRSTSRRRPLRDRLLDGHVIAGGAAAHANKTLAEARVGVGRGT
jgi:hypothetical protein